MAAYDMLVSWKKQRQGAHIEDSILEEQLKIALELSGLKILKAKVNFRKTKRRAMGKQMAALSS